MRNSIKAVFAVGVTALIISGSAMAQEAVPTLGNLNFGEVGVAGGDPDADTAACIAAIGGVGTTCTTIATGAGFTQRQIGFNGETYIQTVIVDPTSGFASEDFVKITFNGTAGGGIPGVASKLSVAEGNVVNGEVQTGAGDVGFVADSIIFSGWANETVGKQDGDSIAKIRVDIGDNLFADKRFAANFYVDSYFKSADDTNIVNALDIDQTVALGAATDVQRFVTHIKPADTTPSDPFKISAASPTQVTFAQDDIIQVVWVGQEIANLGTFGTQSLTNLTTSPGPNSVTTFTSLSETGPFNWADGGLLHTEFGTQPTF